MKRVSLFALALVLGALAFSGQVMADTYTLSGVGSNPYQGEMMGPYTATSGSGATLPIICDDFNTVVYQGQSWNATVVSFSDPNFLKDVKFGGLPNAMTDYLAAAYLAEKIFALSTTTQTASTKLTEAELGFALWGIFSSTAYAEMDAQSKFYYADAMKNGGSGNYSNIEFLVPNPRSSFQEYITIVPTPEPSTLILLACGAMLLISTRKILS